MATMQKNERKPDKKDIALSDNHFAQHNDDKIVVDPIPIDLLYPPDEQVVTFTDPDIVSQLVPEIDNQDNIDSFVYSNYISVENRNNENDDLESQAMEIQEVPISDQVGTREESTSDQIILDSLKYSLHSEPVKLYPILANTNVSSDPNNDPILNTTLVPGDRLDDHSTDIGEIDASRNQIVNICSDENVNVTSVIQTVPYVNDSLARFRQMVAENTSIKSAQFHHKASDFKRLVQRYYDAEIAVDQCIERMNSKLNTCMLSMADVWIKRTGTSEQKKHLRKRTKNRVLEPNDSESELSVHVNFTHAELSRNKLKIFERNLKDYEAIKVESMTLAGYECTMAIFTVEQRILSTMSKSPVLNHNGDPTKFKYDEKTREVFQDLRIYFSVLISFEKQCSFSGTIKYPWRLRFLETARCWLNHVGSGLLYSGISEERVFLLNHLTRYPGIGESKEERGWALHFLQTGRLYDCFKKSHDFELGNEPTEKWTEAEIDNFVAMLEILLRDILQNMSFTLSSSKRTESRLNHVDNTILNTNKTDSRFFLNETDSVGLIKQCNCTSGLSKFFSLDEELEPLKMHDFSRIFSRAEHVMSLLCDAYEEVYRIYPKLSDILINESCSLVVFAAKFFEKLKILKPHRIESNSQKNPLIAMQICFDRLSIMLISSIIRCFDMKCVKFLNELKLSYISDRCAWRIFLALILGYTGRDIFHLEYSISELLPSKNQNKSAIALAFCTENWPSMEEVWTTDREVTGHANE